MTSTVTAPVPTSTTSTATVIEWRTSKLVGARWIDRDTYVGRERVVLRARYDVDLAVYKAEGRDLHQHVTALYYLAGHMLGGIQNAPTADRRVWRAVATEYARMGHELSAALSAAHAEEAAERHAAGHWYSWEKRDEVATGGA